MGSAVSVLDGNSQIISNGPYIIGYTLCFGLMGTLALQAYVYFTRFPDDQRSIKALVTAVLLLEILITTSVFSGFWISVRDQGAAFIGSPTSTTSWVLAAVTAIVIILTQGFYCWRISSLRRSRLVPLLIMMVSLLQFASLEYFMYDNGLAPLYSMLYQGSPEFEFSPWLVIWLVSSVVCDLSITIYMILSLRRSFKSHFGGNKSNLVRLTRFTIETGIVTTAAAIIELILGTVYSSTLFHIAVFFTLSKLYANCLLASLNFRLVLRGQSDLNPAVIVWDEAELDMDMHSSLLTSHGQRSVGRIVARIDRDTETFLELDESYATKKSSAAVQTCQFKSFNRSGEV